MPIETLPEVFDRDRQYYIAGPMSGIDRYNYPAFEEAMNDFRGEGILTQSPHEPYHTLSEEEHKKTSYEGYIRVSLRLLLRCDGIILLPGWTQSKGARREADIAMDLKYPVWFYNFKNVIPMDLATQDDS